MDKFLSKKREIEEKEATDEFSPAKKKKLEQKYRSDWGKQYAFIRPSTCGVYHAFCQCCSQHLAIRCGGLDDINKHIATAKHKRCEKDISSMRPLQFSIVKEKDDLSVIRAETVFTRWLVNHNIQLAAADGFGDVLRSMVPDSKIAQKYKCARTKSTHIALTLASDTAETLARAMLDFPFSLATDGSNDNNVKLFPMVITYFDDCAEEVRTSILSVPELTEASTGSNNAGLIQEQLKKYSIQVGNMLSFVSDDTASMVGCHNGVTSKLREAHPHLLTVGCACHLINLAAKKSFQQLPVRIDELLDIYYYLEPSGKRLRDFKNYQLLHNDEVRKILKYCPTRWLSLGKCINHLLELWVPLSEFIEKMYLGEKAKAQKASASACKKAGADAGAAIVDSWFRQKETKSSPAASLSNVRLKRIRDNLNSRRTLAYCQFLSWIQKSFDRPNKALQHDKPLIHKTRDILLSMYREFLSIVIKPNYIVDKTDISAIDVKDKSLYIRSQDLYLGEATNKLLEKMNDEAQLQTRMHCRAFLIKSLSYMKEKFPLKDDLLIHASIADVAKRSLASFKDLTFFSS